MSGSWLINGILKLYAFVNGWYENSFIYKIVCRLADYCGGSVILQVLYRLGTEEGQRQFAEGSLFFRILYKIGDGVMLAAEKLYGFLKEPLEGSAFCRVLSWDSLLLKCFRPDIFLSLFVLMMPLVPADYWKNMYVLAPAIALVLLQLWSVFSGKDRAFAKIPPALLLYLCFVCVNLFQSPDFSDSLRVILIFVSCVAIALLIQNIVDTPEKLDFLMGCILLGVCLTSLYGIYQYRAGIEVRADFVDLVASKGLRRVFSTMANPNNYAEYLVLFMPPCFAYGVTRKTELGRFCALCMLAPAVAALVLTASRASYLVILGAAALFVLLINKRLVPFCVLGFLGAVPFLPASIVNRVATIGVDTSSKYRVMIWEASLQVWNRFWAGGVGMGPEAFGKIYRIYSHPDAMNAMHAHNLFLQVWLENGVFAFLALLAFFFLLLKRNLAAVVSTHTDIKQKYYMTSYISSLAAIAMFGMVEYVWFYPRVMLSFWIVIGLALATPGIFNCPRLRDI